jgi:hypothetical protein
MKGRKHFMNSLRALLAAPEPADPLERARWLWLHDTAAQWQDAQRLRDAAWDRIMAGVPDGLSDEEVVALNLPEPLEEAEVNWLWAQLDAVVQKDQWPRHLYCHAV